jgi:hypothetical protein
MTLKIGVLAPIPSAVGEGAEDCGRDTQSSKYGKLFLLACMRYS